MSTNKHVAVIGDEDLNGIQTAVTCCSVITITSLVNVNVVHVLSLCSQVLLS